MTAPMALVDFIPVALFLTAAVMLQRDLYSKMSKGSFALFAGGTFMVVTAGVFKAVWKLLVRTCDMRFSAAEPVVPAHSGDGLFPDDRRADRAALFPSAGKAHGAAGRTGARRIRRNLRIHRHDVLRLRGAMRVAVVVRREAQAETARAAVRIRVRRYALHGLPVVQGFQRPAHELDRRDRQQRRSGPAALRRGAPAQGGSPKLQHG